MFKRKETVVQRPKERRLQGRQQMELGLHHQRVMQVVGVQDDPNDDSLQTSQ